MIIIEIMSNKVSKLDKNQVLGKSHSLHFVTEKQWR